MENFCILITRKLKTVESISTSIQHNATPQSAQELTGAVRALLPEKKRKDGVLCIEYYIGASPSFFEEGGDAQRYFSGAIEWLKKRHGEKNIAGASVRWDEKTPHLVAYVVPWTKDGRMCAKDFLGGTAKLRQMQTDFAREVGAAHGLERGKEGGIAKRLKAERAENENLKDLLSKAEAEKKALEDEVRALRCRAINQSVAIAVM